jgi:uncharacterized protein (TIGR02231 family)
MLGLTSLGSISPSKKDHEMSKRLIPVMLAGGLVAIGVLTSRAPTIEAQVKEPIIGKAPEPKVAAPAPVANGLKIAPNRIASVTVYPNSALITREVDVPEGQGTIELIVSPLPPATIQTSLYSEGSDGARVMTTRFRTRSIPEDTRVEVLKLQDELRQLQQAREKLDGESKALQADTLLLAKLENFTNVATVQATEKGGLNSEQTIAMIKFIMETRSEKGKSAVALQQQIQANQEKSELAQRRLNAMTAGVARTERDAVIVVEKINAGAGKVRLNYLVESASWAPQYKLRAGKTAKDQVQLEYLAAVIQMTGEDWSNVNLVLSTAKPMLNSAPPELQSLQVTVVPKGTAPAIVRQAGALELDEQVKNLRSKAQKDFNDRKLSSGIGLVNTAAALDQSWELLNPDEALKRGCSMAVREGPSVTYHLNTSKLTIPSRTDEQVLEIARIELSPEYYYKAVPILTSHVYRLAELTNRSKHILLPGEATMYIGSDFVGQMSLPLVAIGEKFTAGFGIDPQLQVQRQMISKSRSTQGGNQSLRFEYRILVDSYKSERVKMQVWDRLPHAENDAVGVSIMKTTPELSTDAIYLREQRPKNLLRWDVNVDPGMTGEKALPITYEFKLELDRQMTINSFMSAGVFGMARTPHAAPTLANVSPADLAKIQAAMGKLSPEDRKLAETQVFCAIDQDSPLGSMGPIQKVMVKGQPVFLCCKGCVAEAQVHPDETLAKLQQLMMSRTVPKK